MFQSNPFYMKISGPYALFTDPMSKANGEKFTYQVPTAQALQGIVEAVYWKPTLRYVVDEVKVLKPIQTETKNILVPMLNGTKDLSYYTYLKDVAYAVKFHFEWADRPDMEKDRNEKKHEQILLRSMKRGGRHDIFLGTRECIGEVERLRASEYEGLTAPFSGKISFGIMFHSFSYQERMKKGGLAGTLYSQFAPIVMEDGVITFIRPEECLIRHELHDYQVKEFTDGVYMPVDEQWALYDEEGGMADESASGAASDV
ncbi:type I-C CRISPR-associated protein Cas5c [uncultured Megasphaera sp.]|uniref:type I-C CRISPR-associated protein Cas5c n=1 Tax=uncultured Megasphaera sp. TaxID=165188 RepID=UPI00265CA5AC|nr:type I-C CRISPR-associated protein Cas5c [uncultured Megasphaera sp.]